MRHNSLPRRVQDRRTSANEETADLFEVMVNVPDVILDEVAQAWQTQTSGTSGIRTCNRRSDRAAGGAPRQACARSPARSGSCTRATSARAARPASPRNATATPIAPVRTGRLTAARRCWLMMNRRWLLHAESIRWPITSRAHHAPGAGRRAVFSSLTPSNSAAPSSIAALRRAAIRAPSLTVSSG